MQEQDARKNWRRVTREESILPENKHGWMQGNKSNPLHQATNVLGSPTREILANEDVTMRQDITTTSGAPSSRHGHRKSTVHQTEDLEDTV